MCICPKSFLTCTVARGTISNCSWPPRCCNICSCCGLESVRGQVHMYSFWMKRRLPDSSGSTARLDSKSCVRGDDVVVERSCPVVRRFRVGSLWFVFRLWCSVGHFRRHKLACCTGVAFDVVVRFSLCFMFFSRAVCVCFEVCFVVLKRRLF